MATDPTELLETRIAELDEEAGRIRRALEHLDGEGAGRGTKSAAAPRKARGTGSSPGAGTRKATEARKGKRARRGQRREELLKAIKRMRGASPNELADALQIRSTQVHALLRAAEADGLIERDGQGFKLLKKKR